DRLLLEPVVRFATGHRVIPALDHLPQVACGCLHRRNTGQLWRRAPGENRSGTVYTGMTQPGLRTSHEPAGNARALVTCEFAHGIGTGWVPGQSNRAGGKIMGPGQVEERRQERTARQLTRGHELWNQKRLNLRSAFLGLPLKIDVPQRTVGGS